MYKTIILAVLVGVLVSGPAQSQQPPEVNAANQDENVIDAPKTRTDILIVVFTGLLTITSMILAFIAYGQHKATRVAERAYVKMSHKPGVLLDSFGSFAVTISVKNYGQTPARILDIFLKTDVSPIDDPMPTVPDYRANQLDISSTAFLVTNDEYFIKFFRSIPDDQAEGLEDGTRKLWLMATWNTKICLGQNIVEGMRDFMSTGVTASFM